MSKTEAVKTDKRPAWAKAADVEGAETTRTDIWWAAPEGLLEAIDGGTIEPTKAAQIARLPAEEQGAAIESAATATVEETRRKVNEKKAAREGKVATTRFSPKEIKTVAVAAQKGNLPQLPSDARMLLAAINGEALPDEVPAWLAALLTAAGRGP